MRQPSNRILTAGLLALPLLLILLGVFGDQLGVLPPTPGSGVSEVDSLPSSTAVDPAEVEVGLPLLSLWVDGSDLHDPVTGILANTLGTGRSWERPGFVSYFDDAALLFATSVGVRIYGGSSRWRSPFQSYRLYFRDEFGADRFEPGVLFNAAADPIRRLVLHNDRRSGEQSSSSWSLVNPLAYAIANRLGALVPLTEPVRFFLNGQWQDVYVLTESFGAEISENPDYFTVHFGHDQILGPFDPRAKVDTEDVRIPMKQLGRWVRDLGRPLTMRQVSERIDVENLTRWFLSVLFCATDDAYQLPGPFYDSSKPAANWFWINWDIDQSFRRWDIDLLDVLREHVNWGPWVRASGDVRPSVLTSLLTDDEEYREYFKSAFARMLNHQLTEDFLDEQFDHYANIARMYGVEDLGYLEPLREFLTRRPDTLWGHATRRLETGQPLRCTIRPPAGGVLIDGELVTETFNGRYFPGMVIDVSLPSSAEDGFSHWVVNGQRVDGNDPHLQIRLESDVTIEVHHG